MSASGYTAYCQLPTASCLLPTASCLLPTAYCLLPLLDLIVEAIRRDGPLTLAAYMDLALYHPEHGYYAGAGQRSGKAGDFYTSVDVGPLFGELLAVQFAEMHALLARDAPGAAFDLVEAAAGNGRLSHDVLDAAERHHPAFYASARLTLVERSAAARQSQRDGLGSHAVKLAESRPDLPAAVRGVIFANELLDAMPAHAVVMRGGTLREIYIDHREGRLVEVEGALSTPALAEYFDWVGARLDEGARAEVSLAAREWVRGAAGALSAGFLVLIDYGHTAAELYSRTHAGGTLMAYHRHTAGAVDWLSRPGEVDLTTHVDLTALRLTAESAGLTTVGVVDQTYFLTALGLAERLETGHDRSSVARRLAAKTLVMPGGLGSTMKAAVFARGLGAPALRGLADGRLT
jgi:SAM-dependent MidA family methyltransferase